ncbi:MAG TPA: helix-turn-helix domain-containing protein [Thermoleophilaceae bacterium]|nr:helix-turn-helix domain-containing protein [Thermoleophilaceae bacterium]
MPRSYTQHCGIAVALDLVGERWTLLLVRELVPGPRRWTDLLEGLPGIGTGLLASRLRELESEGLVMRRTLPPPAASVVYELTGEGRLLEPVLEGLARFGIRRLGAPAPGRAVRARWIAMAMRTLHDADAASGPRRAYEFRLDGEVFHAVTGGGAVQVADGPAEEPHVVIEGDAAAFLAAVGGSAGDRLRVSGSAGDIARMRRVFAPAAGGMAPR